MQTQYRVRSSIQPSKRVFDVKREEHPLRDAAQKLTGVYQLKATVEEDTATQALLKHVPDVVAFLCTIERDGRIVGQGRGSAALHPQRSRFISRTVRNAFNASVVDAIMRVKSLDILAEPPQDEGAGSELITERQKSYLLELVQTKVAEKSDREQWMKEIDGLSKEDASLAISHLTK